MITLIIKNIKFFIHLFLILILTLNNFAQEYSISDSTSRFIPLDQFNLKPIYFKYKALNLDLDSINNDSTTNSPSFLEKISSTEYNIDDNKSDNKFSSLKKSGVIYRGISIGSSKDFSINSGLNLNINGKLYNDIEIDAALSDENIPLSDAGTTESFSNIENIYIRLKHPHFFSQMGDYRIKYDNRSEFYNFEKKLSGVYLKANYDDENNTEVAFAVSKGEFNTNSFYGLDGISGPYRLSSKSGNNYIVVTGGSEKIYLNGELLTKGSKNDYIIDYSTAEIFFTNKRNLSTEDRIVVDFEYTEENYKKNLYNFTGDFAFFDKMLKFKNSFFMEYDDSDNPLSFDASDENSEIIKNAGDDPFLALKNGADSVDIGEGNYIFVNSSLDSLDGGYFQFVGRDSIGNFNVSFSKFETGGLYNRMVDEITGEVYFEIDSLTFSGEYLPYIILPLPETVNIFNSVAEFDYKNKIHISGEILSSKYQRNSIGVDKNNQFNGFGDIEKFRFNGDDIIIDRLNLGRFGIEGSRRFINKRLKTPGRYENPELNYELGLGILGNETNNSNLVLDSLDKSSYKVRVNYNYKLLNRTSIEYNYFDSEEKISSNKYIFSTDGSSKILHKYNMSISRRETNNDLSNSIFFIRDNFNSFMTYKLFDNYFLTPSFGRVFEKYDFFDETNNNIINNQKGLIDDKYGMNIFFNENIFNNFIESKSGGNKRKKDHRFELNNYFYLLQKEKIFDNEQSKDEISYDDLYYRLKDNYSNIPSNRYFHFMNKYSNTIDFSYKYKTILRSSISWNRVLNEFVEIDSSNFSYDLAKLKVNYNYKRYFSGKMDYEVERTIESKKTRQYYQVTESYGNYRREIDNNGNYIYIPDEYGDYNYYMIDTGEQFPLTGVRFFLDSYIDLPEKEIDNNITFWLSRLDFDFSLKLEEKSTRNDILETLFFQNLSSMESDSSTKFGLIEFDGNVYLLRGKKHSFEYRFYKYNFTNSLNTSLNQIDRNRKHSLSMRNKFYKRNSFILKTTYSYQNQFSGNNSFSYSNLDILSHSILEYLSFTFNHSSNISLRLKYRYDEDLNSAEDLFSHLIEAVPSFSFSFLKKGKIRSEFSFIELFTFDENNNFYNSNQSNDVLSYIYLPYQMGEGNSFGESYKWKISFDYNINNYISSRVSYDGRKLSRDDEVIHELSAEVRMTF